MKEKADTLLDPEFIKKLHQLQILSRKTFSGKMKGERRSRKKGVSIEFADYRRYVKGDDIRFVDWNIYSRLETLFVKLFIEEEDLFCYVLLDASKSMDFGAPTKLHFAKKVAAALGYIALNRFDKLAIGAVGSELHSFLKPTRGKHNVFKMLEFLAAIQPQERTNLAKAFRTFTLSTSIRGIVVLISDFLDPAGFEDALKVFIQRNFEIYVIHVLSEEEMHPKMVGHLELIDSEFDLKTHVSINRDLVKRYEDNLSRFCASLQQFCVKRNITYIRMQNTSQVDDLIFHYLKYRGLLK